MSVNGDHAAINRDESGKPREDWLTPKLTRLDLSLAMGDHGEFHWDGIGFS